MADLDTDLRNRLSRLADAVPVAPGRLDPVHRSAVAARQTVRMAWLTPLVVLVAIVVGGSLLNVGNGAPDGTPITATTRSGDFELTIRSEKARYEAGEPIEISASLTYRGAEPVTIVHALGVGDSQADGGGPLGFGIVEPVIGNLKLETAWLLSRNSTILAPGGSVTSPFVKGTATSGSDPRIPEYTAYLEDPVLRLTAGTWHPFAIADFSVGEGANVSIRAQIEIQVVAPSSAEVSGPTPFANGPVSDSDRNGDFELVIRSPKARYEPDERIEVVAALTNVGPGTVTIAHALGARGSALGFGIEEPVVGDLRLAPDWDEACARTELYSDAPQDYEFWKSGSWSSDDPLADEYHDFVFEPELRLPDGTWHVYAVAEFSVGDCSADPIRMRVDITIDVGGQVPADSLGPPSADQRGIDLMTALQPATGCYQAFTQGRLTRHPVTGLGIAQGTVMGVVWPYGFTAREMELGVAVLVGADGRVVAREGQVVGFSGPGASGEDGLIHACSEVRIVEDDPTNPEIGAVEAVDDDRKFRLELRSSKSTYSAGEPLDIWAILAYVGGNGTAGDFSGVIRVSGTQADGPHWFASGPTVDMCVFRAIRDLPDELDLGDWRKVRSLPPGTWHISASFSGSAPACTGDLSALRASIDVTVLPMGEPTGSIALTTSIDSSQHSSEDYCGRDLAAGELALHPTSGLGLVSPSGDLQAIRWPTGFTAETLPDGAILYGEGGQILAREGESVSYPGANAPDGVFTICGHVLFP